MQRTDNSKKITQKNINREKEKKFIIVKTNKHSKVGFFVVGKAGKAGKVAYASSHGRGSGSNNRQGNNSPNHSHAHKTHDAIQISPPPSL
jgi:hypothetical protein